MGGASACERPERRGRHRHYEPSALASDQIGCFGCDDADGHAERGTHTEAPQPATCRATSRLPTLSLPRFAASSSAACSSTGPSRDKCETTPLAVRIFPHFPRSN
uniref:Uncharacterized protein n=1 Tax=Plectus sambesii TaxID=2011161 RepID=A0A914XMX6_9BILA